MCERSAVPYSLRSLRSLREIDPRGTKADAAAHPTSLLVALAASLFRKRAALGTLDRVLLHDEAPEGSHELLGIRDERLRELGRVHRVHGLVAFEPDLPHAVRPKAGLHVLFGTLRIG